ncbi:MAG: type II toxin-antitoxin system RelE/ParE family toxin [Simkania sp.]|nr:type II toxin-antitoxin system RelE/ParE family toxin [Simkania sp.]MCP5490704.1 type II toxin-antitoxin system RelE/ParE family toxin [Chlamydiales bacterium]
MIRSFKDKNTKSLYEGKSVKKWKSFARQAEKRLIILDIATSLSDLRNLPSNRFESLKGNRKEQYSIRINSQWRICFRWDRGEPYDVEIVDYH